MTALDQWLDSLGPFGLVVALVFIITWAILWLLVPFIILRISWILNDIRAEQRTTNKLLRDRSPNG